jgi:SAM-dependent methyltransferase
MTLLRTTLLGAMKGKNMSPVASNPMTMNPGASAKDYPPDVAALKRAAAYSGDPWGPKNPYFAQAEASMDALWERLIAPFIARCDARRTVDLACGQGRNTRKLLPLAEEVIGLDYQEGNVQFCRDRFADAPQARFAANNGFDLQPVPDGWATLVYSFDAMVHFEPEVVSSYLVDCVRVLAPGGSAFLHHSNYSAGKDWRTNPASRNAMTADRFARMAREAGLNVIEQRVIPWGEHIALDCLSLLQKPEEPRG